jgi:transcriptional regulator with XRE-family HTH domain
MCLKQHIYNLLASRRRLLGMSQQELAERAGLRREKVNRIESKGEDIGLDELSRLLDAVGLELSVSPKVEVNSPDSASPPIAPLAQLNSRPSQSARRHVAKQFQKASFIDGSRAKILNWGKVPR